MTGDREQRRVGVGVGVRVGRRGRAGLGLDTAAAGTRNLAPALALNPLPTLTLTPTPTGLLLHSDSRLPMQSHIRIKDVHLSHEDFLYRTPIKFGGVAVDRVTIANVDMDVETRAGTVARGFGSMPIGNVWAYPSRSMTYDQTLAAMRAVTERVATVYARYREFGHPIDITYALEHQYLKEADDVGKRLGVADPIPVLATLVCASPFDAALHDAFGKAQGLNCYST